VFKTVPLSHQSLSITRTSHFNMVTLDWKKSTCNYSQPYNSQWYRGWSGELRKKYPWSVRSDCHVPSAEDTPGRPEIADDMGTMKWRSGHWIQPQYDTEVFTCNVQKTSNNTTPKSSHALCRKHPTIRHLSLYAHCAQNIQQYDTYLSVYAHCAEDTPQ
jgi:hypothetical protein